MSDNQTDIDLNELASLRRASSLSNHSESSISSRSTLIKELLTSTKSKLIIDEIDSKITQLIDVIKAKKCDEKRKKYYTKKIITRIIDNRCSETSINTIDFGKNTLPSSTPFDSGKEKTFESRRSSDSKRGELLTEAKEKNEEKTEDTRNDDIKESSHISYDSTPLTTNRDRDLRDRLKRLAEEIDLYVRTPSNGLSPARIERSREATSSIITQLEDNLKEVKSSLTTNVKEVESSQTTHVETDIEFKSNTNIPVDLIHSPKETSNHEDVDTCERQKLLEKQIFYLQNKEHGQGDERKINETNKFKDLTPRMLCDVYKAEFSDIASSDKNSPVGNEDKPDATRSRDWRYYKTTSEKIFEEHHQTRKIAKEYIIKYAKKEKQRQIEWITNEIKCLTKLKDILERNSSENLSLSSSSSQNPSVNSFKNTSCSGVKSLKEINSCLDELHKILQEKKSIKSGSSSSSSQKITSKENSIPQTPIESNIVINKPKNTSSSESITTYQKVCPKFKKPTDFEIKYFQENFLSSRTSSEDNKENHHSRTSFESNKRMRNIEVQTSFSNSPQPSNARLCLNNNMPSRDSNLSKGKSVAYILTFEEGSLRTENGVEKTKSSLEKIVVQLPSPRLKKSKFTFNNNNHSELELQEALFRNRSDFIKAAEWRRQCINELTYMRDRRYEDMNKRILFTTKEMRDITSKKYKLSEEVQNKIKTKQNELQKVFNRQLASVFSKKLQEKTLKGQVSIATAKTVTYT